MQETVLELLNDVQRDLENMKRSEMKISERIKYEKGLVKLEIARKLVRKFNLQ